MQRAIIRQHNERDGEELLLATTIRFIRARGRTDEEVVKAMAQYQGLAKASVLFNPTVALGYDEYRAALKKFQEQEFAKEWVRWSRASSTNVRLLFRDLKLIFEVGIC
jgi:hypothetical protein